MSTDVLEKVKLLPPDEQKEVENFILSLLHRHDCVERREGPPLAERRRMAAGWAKGQIWMADDFDETPEDFKDYL